MPSEVRENTTASKLFVMEKTAKFQQSSLPQEVWCGDRGKTSANTEDEQKVTKNLGKVRTSMPRKEQQYTHTLKTGRSWQSKHQLRKGVGLRGAQFLTVSKSDRGVHMLNYTVVKGKWREKNQGSKRNKREVRSNNASSLPVPSTRT